MTYEKKVDLILKAISEAQKFTRGMKVTKLHLTADNGLQDININEVYDILCKIRDEEKVIDIRSSSADVIGKIQRGWNYNKDYFDIDILKGFSTWFNKHLIKEKSKIENLSEQNFNNVAHIMHLIEQGLEISQSEKFVISFISFIGEIEGYEREDIDDLTNTYFIGLSYLKNIGVLKDFTSAEMSLSSEVTLNIPRFFEILEKVDSTIQQQSQQNPVSEQSTKESVKEKTSVMTDEVLYEITFTDSRAILLNKAFQIAKPDFNSENDLVFGFLYKNSNKKHSSTEIEKAIGKKLTKTLHKIVENLGFKGDIKTAFIDVTKDTICFRNPITENDLEKLGISKIKLPK